MGSQQQQEVPIDIGANACRGYWYRSRLLQYVKVRLLHINNLHCAL